jgi:hypothetical protein
MQKKRKKSKYIYGFWVLDTYTQKKEVDLKDLNHKSMKESLDMIFKKYR